MRFARLITGALFVAGLLGSVVVRPTLAQTQNVETFTLQPGGQAMLMFEAYCLDFGRAFPDTVQQPAGVAPDPIRGALLYARSQNLTDTKEEAVALQYAIWRLSNVQGSPQGDALTEHIINNAQSANITPPAGATSLLDAASAHQVSVTVNAWQPLGEEIQIGNITAHYRGTGQLTVKNMSQQPLMLYMPVGTVLPAADQAVQNMTGFTTSVQVQNPATPTPQPTTTPMPTNTSMPTTPTPQLTQQPQQLPDTGADRSSPAGLLGLVAVGALGMGWFAVRQAKHR